MNEKQYAAFLQNIRQIRTKKDIRQHTVARRIGVTPTAYCRMENGQSQITVASLFLIAEALKVSPHELLIQ
ncbi:helix-turn-helix transcriptional regulator [Rurimicrobium arvi]|uniref:HTH cro/C1-type domain-containing protein n=1 Tax=Rurimicrobium arvi TaxID=2049916 RepID=A0ABP8MLM7_9BACT